MSTKTEIRKVVNAVSGLTTAVSNTFAEQAQHITNVCREVFGNSCWSIPKADMQAIVEGVAETATWKGTSSEKARRSEVTTVVKAYPFLGSAASRFKSVYGELRREHLVKIARLAPTMPNAESCAAYAIEYFEARDEKNGKASNRTASVGMAIGIIKKLEKDPKVSARKLIAFRKDLAKLCAKHGIAY